MNLIRSLIRRVIGRPAPRVFHLGDRMGCNACDKVLTPLVQHTNGGWYCRRCSEEIEHVFGIGRVR